MMEEMKNYLMIVFKHLFLPLKGPLRPLPVRGEGEELFPYKNITEKLLCISIDYFVTK